jgi:acetyltransferase-like isoleucine patch superfamily enzyme
VISQYSIGEFIGNSIYLIYTKCLFPQARLIRLPFYLRGRSRLKYGRGFTVGYGCRFDLSGEGKTLEIGENCKFNDRVHIVAHESVIIGANALLASNIFISDTSHGCYKDGSASPEIAPDSRSLSTSPVRIGENVWIGEGVCVMPGVKIGDGCVVGANAVVTKSFPDNTILGGVPAKALKVWDSNLQVWKAVK